MDDPYEENSQQRQRITQPKPHDHVKWKGMIRLVCINQNMINKI